MKFDHEYIDKNEILNKYLLHQLNKEETEKFEEHMLFCSMCRENMQQLDKVVDTIYAASSGMDGTKINKESGAFSNRATTKFRFIYKVAASFLILIAVGSLIYVSRTKNQIVGNSRHIEKTLPDTSEAITNDTVPVGYDQEPTRMIASIEIDSALYAESLFFEKVIHEVMRGDKIQVESPKKGQIFKPGSKIIFMWEGTSGEIILTVFDNKNELIFENEAISPYIFPEELGQGLYYWQLENDDDVLHAGKFIVK